MSLPFTCSYQSVGYSRSAISSVTHSSPRHRIGIEDVGRVAGGEQLHPDHGEDVDDDDQHEGQVAERAQGGDDDAQQDPHRRPGLGQLQHPQLWGLKT